MAIVYFQNENGNRRFVGGSENPFDVIRKDLQDMNIEPAYFRYYKNTTEWVVDYGSWSCFYKVSDWDGSVDDDETTDSVPEKKEEEKRELVFDPVEDVKFETENGNNLVVSSGWRMADNSTSSSPIFVSEVIGGYGDDPAYRLMYDFGSEDVTVFRNNTELVTMDAVEFDEFIYSTTYLMNSLSSLVGDKYEKDFDADSFRMVIKRKEKKND